MEIRNNKQIMKNMFLHWETNFIFNIKKAIRKKRVWHSILIPFLYSFANMR